MRAEEKDTSTRKKLNTLNDRMDQAGEARILARHVAWLQSDSEY